MKNTKNKSPLKLPTKDYWTLQNLRSENPNIPIVITLRTRLIDAIRDGKIVEIGSVNVGKGRPTKVYSLPSKVTEEFLTAVEHEGVDLVDRAREKLVPVVKVKYQTPNPAISVATKVEVGA